MQFATGDTVVHPRHGIATVRGVEKRGKGKNATTYLQLYSDLKSLTIMVPVDSVEEVGIRPPAGKEEAEVILAILEEESEVSAVWAERNADTVARVQSTELGQASMVIRDLTRHAQRSGKRLSAAENTTLQSCLDTVSLELSLALELTQDETKDLLLSKVGVLADDLT